MNHVTQVVRQTSFTCELDTPLPDELFLGKGTVLPVRGWCYSDAASLQALAILVGEAVTPVANHSWGRTDIFMEQCPTLDRSGNSLLSGFEAVLSFPQTMAGRDEIVRLRATLANGDIVERALGTIRLRPGHKVKPTAVVWPGEGPRVAICMATFNPPVDLFRLQVASLQAQTHTNWVCIVCDDNTPNEEWDRARQAMKGDGRFVWFQNQARLNFYDNFQNVLGHAPADAEFIALCDQDDIWHPDKLQTLLAAFRDDQQLVFSNARVVDQDGDVLSPTFWTGRRNNYTDLSTLMVANTITGAASLFRASLLPDVLPFPTQAGPAFHDHWIGLVALLKGPVGYVDRPLYDYVQHTKGVIGHNYYRWAGALSAVGTVLRAGPQPREMARVAAQLLKQAVADYVFVVQKVVLARTLLLRFPGLPPQRRAILERFGRYETSMRAAFGDKVAAVRERRHTLNLEGLMLWSMAGTRLRNVALRRRKAPLLRKQIAETAQRAAIKDGKPKRPPAAAGEPEDPGIVPVLEYGTTKWIHRNIKPLTLDIDEDAPKRVNLLLATINFDYIFGGYIGMFNLALRLQREGYRTRIILHDYNEWDMETWRTKIQKYPGLTTLFDDVDVISRVDRSHPRRGQPGRPLRGDELLGRPHRAPYREAPERASLPVHGAGIRAVLHVDELDQRPVPGGVHLPPGDAVLDRPVAGVLPRTTHRRVRHRRRRGGRDGVQQRDPDLPPDPRPAHPRQAPAAVLLAAGGACLAQFVRAWHDGAGRTGARPAGGPVELVVLRHRLHGRQHAGADRRAPVRAAAEDQPAGLHPDDVRP